MLGEQHIPACRDNHVFEVYSFFQVAAFAKAWPEADPHFAEAFKR